MKKLILIAGILSLLSSNAFSKTYMCKDEDGNTVFSDTVCGTVERKEMKNLSGPSDATLEKRAIQGCLSHWKEKKPYLSNKDIRIEGHRSQWVTVKKTGARKMIYLTISVAEQKPETTGGIPPMEFRETQQLQCLMLGDGVSVNTYEYELGP